MNKAVKVVITIALFALSCVSTVLLSLAQVKAMGDIMPQAKQVAAFLPFVSVITSAFTFFLLSWLLRLICTFFLYRQDIEIPGKRILFPVFVSTAVTSLANLVRWFLLENGFIKAALSLGAPGVTRDQAFHSLFTDAIPTTIVLAILSAAVPVSMFWKSQPAEKRKGLIVSFGLAYLGWNILGIVFQAGSLFLTPPAA